MLKFILYASGILAVCFAAYAFYQNQIHPGINWTLGFGLATPTGIFLLGLGYVSDKQS